MKKCHFQCYNLKFTELHLSFFFVTKQQGQQLHAMRGPYNPAQNNCTNLHPSAGQVPQKISVNTEVVSWSVVQTANYGFNIMKNKCVYVCVCVCVCVCVYTFSNRYHFHHSSTKIL